MGKYSVSTPSSSESPYSHMTQYSSQGDSNKSGALSKYFQLMGSSTHFASTRMLTFNPGNIQTNRTFLYPLDKNRRKQFVSI